MHSYSLLCQTNQETSCISSASSRRKLTCFCPASLSCRPHADDAGWATPLFPNPSPRSLRLTLPSSERQTVNAHETATLRQISSKKPLYRWVWKYESIVTMLSCLTDTFADAEAEWLGCDVRILGFVFIKVLFFCFYIIALTASSGFRWPVGLS